MIEDINDSDTVAEVRAAFDSYNAALDAGDVDALNAFFWHAPGTVRFGPTENLFGIDEITGFRSSRWKKSAAARTLERVVVTAMGRDFATTSAVFRSTGISSTGGTLGRQSQAWARLPEGWRIIAAHVSQIADRTA